MTCPKCHAQLLPMQSEYFCLQCGEVVARASQTPDEVLKLEETADPILRRAINDVSERPVAFISHVAPPVAPIVKPETAPPVVSPPKVETTPVIVTIQAAPVVAEVAPVTPEVKQPAPEAASLEPVMEPPKPSLPGLSAKPLINLLKPQPLVAPPAPVVAQALHGAPAHRPPQPPKRPRHHWLSRHSAMNLTIGTAAILLTISALNAGTAWYLHNRIYPGVKVAGLELGGQSLTQAVSTVSKTNRLDSITLVIDTTTYKLNPTDLGVTVDEAGAISKAHAIGHSEAVPLIGLYRAWQSNSVVPGLAIDQERLSAKMAQLASSISHPATDAALIMNNATPILIADKTGQTVTVDELREAVIKAITTNEKVVINTTKVSADVPVSVFTGTLSQLQARLGLTLKISIRGKITPVASQNIASWLRWSTDGTKVWADPASINNYVAGLSGSFNRQLLATAIGNAINTPKSTTIVASTRKITSVKVGATAPAPTVRYTYCISSSTVTDELLAGFVDRVASTYARADGWSLGGRIVMVAGATNCNLTVSLVAASDMARYSEACDNQSTCRVGNDVIINAERWAQAPASWKGAQTEYQTELINHETGHWLGFDHAACGVTTPPISQTVATVAGCSANWWAIPAQLQAIKILPGF